MSEGDWSEGGWMRTIGMLLFGDAPEIRNSVGKRVKDDDYLILLNAHHEPVDFRLPPDVRRKRWFYAFDTARPELETGKERVTGGGVTLQSRCLIVLGHAGSPRAVAHPGLPQIQTSAIRASGSSGRGFAARR
jgi:isoamylase